MTLLLLDSIHFFVWENIVDLKFNTFGGENDQ